MKTEVNYCGKPVTGLSYEVASCENHAKCPVNTDCKFDDWNEWNACSASCDGTKRRVRGIAQRAVGNGTACGCSGSECDKDSSIGAREQTGPCNPSKDQKGCTVVGIPVDCELKSWSKWTECAVSCGASQKDRSRGVHIEPVNGGKECDPGLKQTASCGLPECGSLGEVKDCKWAEWSDWGSCDATMCERSLERNRAVKNHAEYGGKNCTGDSSREVMTCNKGCLASEVHCAWSDWGPYSKCDIHCKPKRMADDAQAGMRHRKRNLEVQAVPKSSSKLYEADHDTESQVQQLYRRAQTADSRRWQEVSAAFALGCLSFLIAFSIIPRCGRSNAASRPHSRAMRASSRDEQDLFPETSVDSRSALLE